MTNNYSTEATGVANAIDAVCEKKSNKVTSLSSSSTDTQYPSAKCVHDAIDAAIGAVETQIHNLIYGTGV